MMVGLPESTRRDEIETAKALIQIKTKNGKNLSSISSKNTKLEKNV